MDERQRLLEHTFSREAAAESAEDHQDPVTGDVVRMTPSQWALAEFDRRHDPRHAALPGSTAVPGSTALLGSTELPGSTTPHAKPAVAEQDAEQPVLGVGDRTLNVEGGTTYPVRRRRALPYVAALGGLLLGIVGTLGVQGTLLPAPSRPTAHGPGTIAVDSGAPPSVGSGQGDEGATLVAVTNFFANTQREADLPSEVTRGFDASSFHLVAGTVTVHGGSAIYAAHRLDDMYCLVAVVKDSRAAEACGTLDDITRRGLTLTEDAPHGADGQVAHSTVTVTWQTDGTISWSELPPTD